MSKNQRKIISNLDHCCLIIPALNPTKTLLDLIEQLQEKGFRNIVVINDGSTPDCLPLFNTVITMGVHLISHEKNQGKGSALKSGFKNSFVKLFKVVVTVDADGQHLPSDIVAVSVKALQQDRPTAVLGVRRFVGKVPLRSRFGNQLTQWLFRKMFGFKIGDTQTGLRAFSTEMLPVLQSLDGDRYEFEMNVLVSLARDKCQIIEVPIETVYLNSNSGSHFRPLLDSIRIYAVLFRDIFLSLSSFGLDIALFYVFLSVTSSITLATFAARLFSGTYNFLGNKYFVFNRLSARTLRHEITGYILLATTLAFASSMLVNAFVKQIPVHQTVCKISVDLSLYICSFLVRRYIIFRHVFFPHREDL